METTTQGVVITRFGPAALVVLDIDLVVEAGGDPVPLRIEMPQPDGMQAASWAAMGDWFAMFPNALPEDQRRYWSSAGLPSGALRHIAHQLGHRLFGMPWWAAQELCGRASANWWQYEAWAVGVGFDPRGAPAARIAASCWAWLASACEKPEQIKALYDEIFTAPPPLDSVGAREAVHDEMLARNRAMLERMRAGGSG